MTEIEKAKAVWRICANVAIPLSGSDRAQIANSFKAMIELAEQAEGFEAFKREVSDAVEKLLAWPSIRSQEIIVHNLSRFILPKPVDPLVEVAEELRETYCATGADWAKATRAALAKHGLEIREVE